MKRKDSPRRFRSFLRADSAAFPLLVFVFAFLVELAVILRFNEGHFVYSLDDAYIHLSLAENILRGHYGVNLGEFSAPSSSIVWPFLMAPFQALRLGHLVPLAANFLLALAALVLFRLLMREAFPARRTGLSPWFVTTLVLLLIPATNLLGLTFNGMEHSLHLVLVLATLLGLLRSRERIPGWLPVIIVAAPLVRYESLAISAGAIVYLAWRRRLKTALVCAVLIGVSVIGFSAFLSSLGLGNLPTSVVAKTPHLSAASTPLDFFSNLKRNLTDRQGAVLWVGLLFLLHVVFSTRRSSEDRAVAGWASFALVLHVLIGRFGWFNRYEIYIWTTVLLTAIFLYRDALLRAIGNGWNVRTVLLAGAFLFGACFPYTLTVLTNPLGSCNIYEQQYQMRRFATEFCPGPVAANDIGWLCYRNDEYVLDLWGLASRAALTLHAHQDVPGWVDTDWIREQSAEHDVKLAMLFERWFPNLPEDWVPLGDLHLGRRRVSAARSVVTFYAVGEEHASFVREGLEEYVKTLPKGVRFVFRDPSS